MCNILFYSSNIFQLKKREQQQKWFKIIFFIVALLVFVLTVSIGVVVIYNISKKGAITLGDVGVALSGLGSIISVIIVLPSKIATNLFPATANKEMLQIVCAIQNYDLNSNAINDDDIQEFLDEND